MSNEQMQWNKLDIPEGYKSWFEMFNDIKLNSSRIDLYSGENHKVQARRMNEKGEIEVHTFETNDIKMQAFMELQEIMPKYEKLIELQGRTYSANPMDLKPVSEFLSQILKLYK